MWRAWSTGQPARGIQTELTDDFLFQWARGQMRIGQWARGQMRIGQHWDILVCHENLIVCTRKREPEILHIYWKE